MKKIVLLFFTIVTSFLTSCDTKDVVIPEIISNKYTLETKNANGVEIISIYAYAKNSNGKIYLTIPSADGSSMPLEIETGNIQSMIDMLLISQSDITKSISRLNYIDMRSDDNLLVSYQDEKNIEMIIPDMIKEDGSLQKTLKYRKTFENIFPRITEKLARHQSIPIMGELPPIYSLKHKTDNDGRFLVYMPKEAIIAYSEMLPAFGISEDVLTVITSILKQFNTSNDILEIGVYLKKID